MMIDDLKTIAREAHIGLEVSKLDMCVGMVAFYALYDDHHREVYRGDAMAIIAFINGCKYIRDLYEGH